MTPTPNSTRRPKWQLLTSMAATLVIIVSCGPSEEEIMLAELQVELGTATTTIDSLNYTVESSNMLIDEMRARVDSLGHVDAKLLTQVRKLGKEIKHWQTVAAEHKRINRQLTQEIERMKREKQIDQRGLARLRSQSDSLNTALLDAHTSIRRQEGHVSRLKDQLVAVEQDRDQLRMAETSVRVYAATERFLTEGGYLQSSRSLGRAFRKSFRLAKRLDPTDAAVQLVEIGSGLLLDGELDALVDRYGKLKKGDSFNMRKVDGKTEVTFVDGMLGGVDVVAILKR
jgi:hypothetical protein